MSRSTVFTVIMLAAAIWIGCASSSESDTTPAPTITPEQTMTPLPSVLAHDLEVTVEPKETAIILLNPRPIGDRKYVQGRTVTIDVSPHPGWKVDEWLGPVFEVTGRTAKINMNVSHSVIVRLVQSTAPNSRRVANPLPTTAKPMSSPIATAGTFEIPIPSATLTSVPISELRFDGPAPCSTETSSAFWESKAFDAQGEYENAVEMLDEVIRLDPHCAAAYSSRGFARLHLGQDQEAVQDYNEAIRLAPEAGDVYNSYYNRGGSYSNLGQHRLAIQDFNEAMRLFPGQAWLYDGRARVYERMGDEQKAISDREQACQLDVDGPYCRATKRPRPIPAWFYPIPLDAPKDLVPVGGDVTISLDAGSVDKVLGIRWFPLSEIPPLPPGFVSTGNQFKLAVYPGHDSASIPFTFLKPLTITISLSASDERQAGGVESNVVVQHYQDQAWTPLLTTVDFGAATAEAPVDSPGNFALTIKVEAPALTPLPTPARTPTPKPTPTLVPTLNPETAFVVTKTADTDDGTCDTDCSLREAIFAAGQGATIRIPAGVYTLENRELSIYKHLALIGAGRQNTIIQAANSAEMAGHGVIDIERKNIVSISGVAIRYGNTAFGGGIINDGMLTLTDSSVMGNLADNGGGIHNTGRLTLIGTVVSDNTAAQYGGGIYNDGALILQDSLVSDNVAVRRYGGGIYHKSSDGTLTITRSTISGNKAHYGGGINGGPITMTDSAVSGNTTSSNGGGIHGSGTLVNSVLSGNTAREDGGALAGAWRLTNVTISGNIAGQRGGGIFSDSNPLILTNSTITRNEARVDGGGVYSVEGAVALVNTIIAENSSTRKGPDCYGDITSKGHNIVGDRSDCALFATTGDQVGASRNSIDPRLGPLQDNGGPTESHGLSLDSPAIDAADNATCPSTDQRGIFRSKGAACDIGAYER